MKYFLFLLILVPSLSFARVHYIEDSRGRKVQIITPRQLQKIEQQKKNKLDGVGQEYFAQARVEEKKVKAWIRGCNWVVLGDLENEFNPMKLEELEKIKNGDRLTIKMKSFGSCEVADFRK